MAMSVSMQEAHKVAEEYNRKLLATDQRLQRCVQIIDEEGSVFFFRSAFLMRWQHPKGDWYVMVFSEHQGFHVYAGDELYGFAQFEQLYDVEILGG